MTPQRGRQIAGAILALGGLSGIATGDEGRQYAGSLSILAIGLLMLGWDYFRKRI